MAGSANRYTFLLPGSGIGDVANPNRLAKLCAVDSARRLEPVLGMKYTLADSDALGTDPSIVSSWKISCAEGEACGVGNFSAGSLPNA